MYGHKTKDAAKIVDLVVIFIAFAVPTVFIQAIWGLSGWKLPILIGALFTAIYGILDW